MLTPRALRHILVGGLEHFLFFHILGTIIPTDSNIFQRYTTNQYLIWCHLTVESTVPPSTNELAQALSLQEAKLQTVTAGHGGIIQDFFNGQSRVIHGTLWL